MKKLLNWKDHSVVEHYNEVSLWSAPFGRLLLENIPMREGMTVLDIGFGTGFPLIELSQRFGKNSTIYGIDIWKEAIQLTKKRIAALELSNITIIKQSAESIPLADQQINLVTSNLGVNNFEHKGNVYDEIHRVLKSKGRLCITTNPIGTFEEFFALFEKTLQDLSLEEEQSQLKQYLANRQTKNVITQELQTHGFQLVKSISDQTNMRFVDAEALLDHALIRIGFREGWEEMIPDDKKDSFFTILKKYVSEEIRAKGAFSMKIPMLYLEFAKV